MEQTIKKRVAELEKELANEKVMIGQLEQEINRLGASVLSKGGAIAELKKLLEKKDG